MYNILKLADRTTMGAYWIGLGSAFVLFCVGAYIVITDVLRKETPEETIERMTVAENLDTNIYRVAKVVASTNGLHIVRLRRDNAENMDGKFATMIREPRTNEAVRMFRFGSINLHTGAPERTIYAIPIE